VNDPRMRLVERGYDAIADDFARWNDEVEGDPREAWTQDLMRLLPKGGRVVDLGCGAGVPSTRAFAEHGFAVTGIDISNEQLSRARANVPGARFVHADLTQLELAPQSVDAVTSYYALNHVPRELLGALLVSIASWLVRGGFLLAALGAGRNADWTGEWLGTEMFFSSWDADTNRRLVRDAPLELIREEVVTLQEPEGAARFHWVLARR
jgi:SAM-dependent methyltransferase